MITLKRGKNKVDKAKLLEDYARDCNFDPLVPDNWYKVKAKDIQRKVYLLTLYPPFPAIHV